jgi:hypothetical protein
MKKIFIGAAIVLGMLFATSCECSRNQSAVEGEVAAADSTAVADTTAVSDTLVVAE